MVGHDDVAAREQAFWDEHVPELDECLRGVHAGPEPNVRAMLDAVEPIAGRRVLDFACGAGVTSVFLAQRGATVTGLDINEQAIARAGELAERVGVEIDFIAAPLESGTFAACSFDAIVGRYALHHVDLAATAPTLRTILAPGGRCAFVETMALNPTLALSRRWLAGRAGIAGLGSTDEHPLDRRALRELESNIGPVRLVVEQMRFLTIFDRNVLRYRHARASALLRRADDRLLRLGLGRLSYHQVVQVQG
jgi:SAM-dependent methyltransferase